MCCTSTIQCMKCAYGVVSQLLVGWLVGWCFVCGCTLGGGQLKNGVFKGVWYCVVFRWWFCGVIWYTYWSCDSLLAGILGRCTWRRAGPVLCGCPGGSCVVLAVTDLVGPSCCVRRTMRGVVSLLKLLCGFQCVMYSCAVFLRCVIRLGCCCCYRRRRHRCCWRVLLL